MKNKIYYFGILCCMLLLFGCLFKIQHWPGAGIIISVGFILFTLVFIPVALINSYKSETDHKLKWLYIIGFICILIVCIGALFKIQHWPGAGIMLLFGLPLPFVLFLPAYFVYLSKDKQLNYKNILQVLYFFAYFGAISALLSLNVSKDVIDESILSASCQEQKMDMTHAQTLAIMNSLSLKDASEDTKNSIAQIREKSERIYQIIDNLKVGIVTAVDANNHRLISGDGDINLWNIYGKDAQIGGLRNLFENEITALENQLQAYESTLISLMADDTEKTTYIKHWLNIKEAPWRTADKQGIRLIFHIQTLDLIKKNIGLATLEAMATIEEENS